MTVIVAVNDGARVCMACDSQATNNGAIAILARPKIKKIAGCLVGGDGSFATLDAFARSEFASQSVNGDDLDHWLRGTLCPWLWQSQREAGRLRRVQDYDEMAGSLLVACGSQFRIVDSVGGVVHLASPWWAIGSGAAAELIAAAG